ncbi:hypothetical protein BDV25DRAFT_128597 [Aspergillus avenaceus]|uniref:Zn(II)2Cys6 transcription factor n=1 Tax=Aspergillus avenaceus TaxID=36643 RepID=A0A5N6TZ46_ASPAV|nr:hypothetical protein BDV25DRAFT_128597 [Aspergillus avenaceus]
MSRPPALYKFLATERSLLTEDSYPKDQRKDMMDAVDHGFLRAEPNMQELELMMQWCTTTYRTLPVHSETKKTWQVVIPQTAMHHPSLMHGILALSALHLASNSKGTTKKRYLETAVSHQSRALTGLTKTGNKSNDSTSNVPLLSLSALMTIFSFGLPITVDSSNERSSLDEILRVFKSFKASSSDTDTATAQANDREMQAIIGSGNTPPQMPDTHRLAIMSLSRLNARLARQDPRHEKDVFDVVIENLGNSFNDLARGGEFLRSAFQWVVQMPPRFEKLLEERQKFALVILAHFTVIIHYLRKYWWMSEWGSQLIHEISQLLGPEWLPSINWVIDSTSCYV